MKMNILITGASSGLGLHTARALHQAGHCVIAGARSFTGTSAESFHCLPLDVTDHASVASFISRALTLVPCIDAVVHCAGMLILGPCEETCPEEYQRVLDTNFLGVVRINRHVLPHMRANGGGRIVMFSSINGLMGVPFQSAYTASKHAMEGYAECLAMEARAFNIQVCLVEPGDHRSGSSRYRLTADATGNESPYHAQFSATAAVIRHDEANGSCPDALGRRIVRLLARRRLPLRSVIASADQRLAVWLKRLLPPCVVLRILRAYYFRHGK